MRERYRPNKAGNRHKLCVIRKGWNPFGRGRTVGQSQRGSGEGEMGRDMAEKAVKAPTVGSMDRPIK